MKNKIIALIYLLGVYIPAVAVVAQEAFEVKLPPGSSDPLALSVGFGLIFFTPVLLIRLMRSK